MHQHGIAGKRPAESCDGEHKALRQKQTGGEREQVVGCESICAGTPHGSSVSELREWKRLRAHLTARPGRTSPAQGE